MANNVLCIPNIYLYSFTVLLKNIRLDCSDTFLGMSPFKKWPIFVCKRTISFPLRGFNKMASFKMALHVKKVTNPKREKEKRTVEVQEALSCMNREGICLFLLFLSASLSLLAFWTGGWDINTDRRVSALAMSLRHYKRWLHPLHST